MTLQHPFDHLHRDSDVEGMTDGDNANAAYGEIYGVDDASMGWSRYAQGTRHMAFNSGLFFIRANERTVDLLTRIADKLSAQHAWDQSVWNEFIFFLSHGDYRSPQVVARTMDYLLVRVGVCGWGGGERVGGEGVHADPTATPLPAVLVGGKARCCKVPVTQHMLLPYWLTLDTHPPAPRPRPCPAAVHELQDAVQAGPAPATQPAAQGGDDPLQLPPQQVGAHGGDYQVLPRKRRRGAEALPWGQRARHVIRSSKQQQ